MAKQQIKTEQHKMNTTPETNKKVMNVVNNATVEMIENVATMRREVLYRLLNPGKDLNYECGYPSSITTSDYRDMFDRDAIARRVVEIFPLECWKAEPRVFETVETDETAFEKDFNDVLINNHLWHYLQRADVLSGIGRFGVILLGINDKKSLKQPLDLNKKGKKKRELLYMRAFDENVVTFGKRVKDKKSPRFGMPETYKINFSDEDMSLVAGSQEGGYISTADEIHWSRIIHIADGRECSDIYGVPRMKAVYNRLLDLRKIYGGAGEMFWKGGFPGYVFEVNPDNSDATLDTDTLREEFEDYSQGLQRYLAIAGVTAKSLKVQLADPRGHIEVMLKAIAIRLGIPNRVLMGSEEAKLSSVQDKKTWNERVAWRQSYYLTPFVIRNVIDRLIDAGVLTAPQENNAYTVQWPDLNAPSDEERAKIADLATEAMGKYTEGGVWGLMDPVNWLVRVAGWTLEEAEEAVNTGIGMEEVMKLREKLNPYGRTNIDGSNKVEEEGRKIKREETVE